VEALEIPPNPSDPTLAFADVYDEFFAFVYRNARRLGVPETAIDDVTQDVFLVIHRRLHEYDGRATLRSWVYGVLLNTVRGYRRTVRRKQTALVPVESDDEQKTQELHLDDREPEAFIYDALSACSRACFVCITRKSICPSSMTYGGMK